MEIIKSSNTLTKYKVISLRRLFNIEFFSILLFNSLLIVDFFRMLVGSNLITEVIKYVIYLSIFAFVLVDFVSNKKSHKKPTAIVFMCFIFLIILSYCLDPGNEFLTHDLFIFLGIRIIPGFYLLSNICSSKRVFDKLYSFRFLWFLYSILGVIYITTHITRTYNIYSMNYGYNLLVPACIVFSHFLKKPKITDLVYLSVFAFCILYRGSRGALLCLILFILFSLLFLVNKKSVLKSSLFIMCFVLLLIPLYGVLQLTHIVDGISFLSTSRTFLLLNKGFSYDSGRNAIFEIFLNKINEKPFQFRGFYSDRLFYSQVKNLPLNSSNYPHNIIIEILFQFGYVYSTLIFALFMYIFIKLLKKWVKLSFDTKMLVCVLGGIGIIQLLFSDSYLENVYFYMFFGLIYAIIWRRDNENLFCS